MERVKILDGGAAEELIKQGKTGIELHVSLIYVLHVYTKNHVELVNGCSPTEISTFALILFFINWTINIITKSIIVKIEGNIFFYDISFPTYQFY